MTNARHWIIPWVYSLHVVLSKFSQEGQRERCSIEAKCKCRWKRHLVNFVDGVELNSIHTSNIGFSFLKYPSQRFFLDWKCDWSWMGDYLISPPLPTCKMHIFQNYIYNSIFILFISFCLRLYCSQSWMAKFLIFIWQFIQTTLTVSIVLVFKFVSSTVLKTFTIWSQLQWKCWYYDKCKGSLKITTRCDIVER